MQYHGKAGDMANKRFKLLGNASFFGNLLYKRAVRPGHFLRQLERVINWQVISERLIRLYVGRAEEGRPPYDPVVILRMLLPAYLYVSDHLSLEPHAHGNAADRCSLQGACHPRCLNQGMSLPTPRNHPEIGGRGVD